MSVGLDLWGLGSKVLGGDNLNTTVVVDVNLKNTFFPVAEVGFSHIDAWNDYGTHYKSSAPFFRLGIDYNVLHKKKFKNYLLVGLRYAMSSFNYQVTALGIDDPIWGGGVGNPQQPDDVWGGSQPFDHQMKATMQWFEINVTLRAHIWKAIYMGWSLRMKYRTTSSIGENGNPWQVPGFGKYGGNTMGIAYTITYLLPYKKK
jgi:hypothetical protein